MTVIYLVQHAEKQRSHGDPGLTARGRAQAAATGHWLRHKGLTAVYASPLLRARQTAEIIAESTGLVVREDARLRERLNWDGTRSIEEFVADWACSVRDRDYVPRGGDSSRQAGQRLRAFLADRAEEPGPIVAVTHGGVTVDLLRTVLGDQALLAGLMDEGVPSCAITMAGDGEIIGLPSTGHLSHLAA